VIIFKHDHLFNQCKLNDVTTISNKPQTRSYPYSIPQHEDCLLAIENYQFPDDSNDLHITTAIFHGYISLPDVVSSLSQVISLISRHSGFNCYSYGEKKQFGIHPS
jgi:hypothetical protein